MMVILIPLFLAASIPVNENDWKYNPEVIYDVRVDSASNPIGQMEKIVTYNLTMKLNCRSKSRLSLSCKLEEPNVVIEIMKNSEKSQKLQEHESLENETFELKFDADGLDEIIVSSSINPTRLDMIRAIVAQLNVGADFSAIRMDEFETLENFTTGTCKTDYILTSRDANEKNRTTKNSYEIVIVPGMSKLKDEIKEIRRTRNLDECHYRIDYFFGSREGQRATPSNIETKIISSKSHMIMSQSNFTSWTENEIIISSKLHSTNNSLTERITLSLNNIVPASGPLTMIPESSTASIFPTRWLHEDDSSEETNDFS